MKNVIDRVLTITAETALEAALASLGFVSHGGTYQPKEPEMLRKYAKTIEKENK